jgi:adenylate kinase
MKLLIFGPQGSGKGTYASRLAEKFGLKKVTVGDLLRAEIKKGSEIGKIIKPYVEKGELVPYEIAVALVKKEIEGVENFILDGFPRDIKQAEELDKITSIDAIIKINAHEEILLEKISARWVCSNPSCDGNYNTADIHKVIEGVEYILPPLLPKKDLICDKCGSKLVQREDDLNIEAIKRRLKIYEEQTKPVIEYYKKKGIPFVEVWMNRPPEVVVEKIVEGLKKIFGNKI